MELAPFIAKESDQIVLKSPFQLNSMIHGVMPALVLLVALYQISFTPRVVWDSHAGWEGAFSVCLLAQRKT